MTARTHWLTAPHSLNGATIKRVNKRLGPQIDTGQQAQVLTSYVGAGILTRNEARVKLGEAQVTDPAANVLLAVTGNLPRRRRERVPGEGAGAAL